jgi:hypothetical protein
MLSRDTHPAVHQMQIAAYRALTPERRAEIVADLTQVTRGMAREGIRLRHPSYTEVEVSRALLQLLYGRDIKRLAEKT